jgi:site-specific DNA-cytosine methylase
MPWVDWIWSAEIEPFPSAVHAARFPQSVNLGDMTADDFVERAAAVGLPDLIVAGTPCFPAGTMVATARGFVGIEDVAVGDEVLTHTGRMRRVVRVGSKTAPTWRLRGQGHPDMVTTANHPFLSRQRMSRSTRVNGASVRQTWWSDADWVRADEMRGRHWAMPTAWPSLPVPPVVAVGAERVEPALSEDLLWLAGAYVGDGWTRWWTGGKGGVVYGVNPAKAALIIERCRAAGLNVTSSAERTVDKLQVCGTALARWMETHFGKGAGEKRLPMWLLGAPENLRRAFAAGYIATDGCTKSLPAWEDMTATTVSRRLAIDLRALGITLGCAASVQRVEVSPTTVIEGRTVRQRTQWSVTWSRSTRTSVEIDGMRWQLVRDASPTGEDAVVYDLEVEDDHSYVADGIVVHNCQAFSVAGLRNSLDDDRGNLTLRFVRICDAIDDLRRAAGLVPLIVLWENVPGVLSVRDNAFGCFLGALVGDDAPIDLDGRKWPGAGVVAGPARVAAWRTLDAQFFGVAQRRRRVFVLAVGGAGGWAAADALLPVVEGVRWHSAPRREAREGVARGAAVGAGGGGEPGGVTEFLPQSSRVYMPDGVAPALQATGTRMGNRAPQVVAPVVIGGGPEGGQIAGTVSSKWAKGTGGPAGDECYNLVAYAPDVSATLVGRSSRGGGQINSPGHNVDQQVVAVTAFDPKRDPGLGIGAPGDPSFSLTATAPHAVAIDLRNGAETGGVAQTLQSHHKSNSLNAEPTVLQGTAVRRLTPVETERLQGLPDGWTDVPYRGKPAADGPRYKSIGNSMAVPVLAWIGDRIRTVLTNKGDA